MNDYLITNMDINILPNDINYVVYPAIYQHFKKKFYATMFVTKPLLTFNRNSIVYPTYLEADFTEIQDTKIKVILKDNNWYHIVDHESMNYEMVIYKSLYDDHIPYARPKSMFESLIDKEEYPDIKQKWRFELVTY